MLEPEIDLKVETQSKTNLQMQYLKIQQPQLQLQQMNRQVKS
jgi:hypothetical protein